MARNNIYKVLGTLILISTLQQSHAQTIPCISDDQGYEGWFFSGAAISADFACNGNGIRFGTKDQYAISPRFSNPLKLTFNKRRSDNNTPWELKIQIGVSLEGPWIDVASTTEITNTCTPNEEIDLSAYTGNFYLRFLDSRAEGTNRRGIDDIKIYCKNECVTPITVNDFFPKTGPEATTVTIKGYAFNNVDKITFGGIETHTIEIKDENTITARVPLNAPDGHISLFNGNCKSSSIEIYSVTGKRNCSNGLPPANEIYISEFYHSYTGATSFIEIFNQTSGIINLADHQYKIKLQEVEIPLTGIIAAGSTFVVKLGSGNSCSGTTVHQTANETILPGSNVQLLKGSTLTDLLNTPDFSNGFRLLRLPESNAPNTSFDQADWIITNEPLCNDLGTAPFASASNATHLLITKQPVDIFACTHSISLSMEANISETTPVWYYLNPNDSEGWQLLSGLSTPANGITVTGSGTSAIEVTGATGSLQNYQFYADVPAGSPQCKVATKAVHYRYPTKNFYRSKANGNWSDTDKWEMSADKNTWESACNFPSAFNCEFISMEHAITLDIDNTVPALEIQSNAKLEIAPNSQLSIQNQEIGGDLTVKGTLTDRSTSTNSVTFLGGATWRLHENATLIKTNSGGAATYRDNYDGSIEHIPSTANWIYRYNGDGNVTVVTANMVYPNLTFESTSGNYSNSFTGSNSTMKIKGNFDVGGTGSGTVTLIYENTFSDPFEIAGDLLIRNGNTLTNDGEKTGTGVNIKGNLSVDGQFIMNGGENRMGVIEFSGSSAQNITGNGWIGIQELRINNSGTGAVVSVQSPIQVAGALNFGSASAKLNVAGEITILSNEHGTANIGTIMSESTLSYAAPGRFTVERYIPGHAKAWQLLSVSTSGSTIHESWQEGNSQGMNSITNGPNGAANKNPGYGITITSDRQSWFADGFDAYTRPGPSMKTYNSNENSWEGVTTTHQRIDNFNAYLVMVRGDRSVISHDQPATPVTLRASGQLFGPGGNAPTPIDVPPNTFVLTGNPYASAIDYDKTGSNLNSSYIIWDPQLTSNEYSAYGLGAYRTISGNVAVPSGGNYTDGNIPPIQSGQAFFVQSAGNLNGTLLFTEECKVTGSAPIFRKGDFIDPLSQLRANLYVLYKDAEILLDGTLIQFHHDYDLLADKLDARKIFNSSENMSISHLQRFFAIERRPLPIAGDSIHYSLSNLRNHQYILELIAQNFIFSHTNAFVEDTHNHSRIPISANDTLRIPFETGKDANSLEKNRFRVVFESVSKALHFELLEFRGRASKYNIELDWTINDDKNIQNYMIQRSGNGYDFDSIGTLSAQKKITSTYGYTDFTAQPGNNFYRLLIKYEDDKETRSKIISVFKADDLRPTVEVYQKDQFQLEISFHNQPRGPFEIEIFSIEGKLLQHKEWTHQGGSSRFHLISPMGKSIYIVKITTANGSRYIKKIFL